MPASPHRGSHTVAVRIVAACTALLALSVPGAAAPVGPPAPPGNGFEAFWVRLLEVWGYKLTTLEGEPITVGKLVVGLVLLVAGFWLSRLLAAIVGRRVLPRLGLNEGAAAAVQSIIYYVLLVTVVLGALRAVNVPLTVFTVLGGALAIGIGFGSQNIVNNFISGLILLAERPIRVGDLVQVGDTYGVVRRIGARSTRIVTSENVDIIVPNSSFLQSNVTNWTLSNDEIRASVEVGVAYGSPTRDVKTLLLRAVEGHGRILTSPGPFVLFTDFGDNSLVFQVHFWIRMRTMMERRTIESDVRFRIDELFREAGVTIAFPQRDVHLNTLSPLEVRIAGAGAATPPH